MGLPSSYFFLLTIFILECYITSGFVFAPGYRQQQYGGHDIRSNIRLPQRLPEVDTDDVTDDRSGPDNDDQSLTFQKETTQFHDNRRTERGGIKGVGIDRKTGLYHGDNNKYECRNTKCYCYKDKTKWKADCSNRKLTRIPQGLPHYIQYLNLSMNNLTSLSLANSPFHNYSYLVALYLNQNNISSLPDNSFQGLSRLYYLTLHDNSIRMDTRFNDNCEAFKPLSENLRRLSFNKNNNGVNPEELVYPDKALSCLKKLDTLEIDGLPHKSFGSNFRQILNLSTLIMVGYETGYCNLTYLSEDTFKNLPNITKLNISDCNIDKNLFDKNVLNPLQRLRTLDLSYNFDLGLEGVGKIMYGQRNNPNLKHLYINIIGHRYAPCVIVTSEVLENFANLKLETIEAYRNNIELIEPGAIEKLPKTLKRINLKRNKIMFGAYWNDIVSLVNLESILLDGHDKAYKLPFYIPPPAINCNVSYTPKERESDFENYPIHDDALHLSFPPNLKHISLRRSSLAYHVTELRFDGNNTAENIDLHGNFFPRLTGPVSGLDRVKLLDLSLCDIEDISTMFFKGFRSLQTLNLYGNGLGDSISSVNKSNVFPLHNLTSLVLGNNDIFRLHKNTFQNPNLKRLNLAENRLRSVNFMADNNLPNLSYLNLSKNEVRTLPKPLRDHFDKIIASGEKVTIDMTFTPIVCDCINLEFLKWVVKNKVFGNDYKDYYCMSTNLEVKRDMHEGYDEEVRILTRQCANNTKLFVCVTIAALAFVIVLVGVVVYRFRWVVRYWYNGIRLMQTKTATNQDADYEYDVLVCHCQENSRFVEEELQVKLCHERNINVLLQERCFTAGHKISENILMAVQQSRKTLMVMSNAMLKSRLCNYELEMAHQEACSTGRNVLVILFLEHIPLSEMNLDMVNYIRSNVIVTYPSNPEEREEFWDKLANDLMSH